MNSHCSYIFISIYISLFSVLEVPSSTYLPSWCTTLITHSFCIARATCFKMLITTPLMSSLSSSLMLCSSRLHLWLTVQLLHFVEPPDSGLWSESFCAHWWICKYQSFWTRDMFFSQTNWFVVISVLSIVANGTNPYWCNFLCTFWTVTGKSCCRRVLVFWMRCSHVVASEPRRGSFSGAIIFTAEIWCVYEN